MHGGFSCTDCHEGITDFPHEVAPTPPGEPQACAACHDTAQEEYELSVHAALRRSGDILVATCTDCHGTHDILPTDDAESRVHPIHLPRTCARCHASEEFLRRGGIARIRPFEEYALSVHGRLLLEESLDMAPSCATCHESHSVLAAGDPRSPVHPQNVPSTCGLCHGDVEQEYAESIHGQALAAGIRDAPTCTDCHSEHGIRRHEDPLSPVSIEAVSQTCAACHGAERLVRRYGLPGRKVSTYFDSFHGLADRYGDTTVAKCDSCHGAHNIKPSTDPESMVHSSHLAETCGACHPGAGETFPLGTIHGDETETFGALVVYWVRIIYIWLIAGTLAFMAAHNLIDFTGKMRRMYGKIPEEYLHLRFTLNERFQHWLLMASFIVLVVSGFALRLDWGIPFVAQEVNVWLRSISHRVAAVVFIAVCLYHIGYLLFARRGRGQWREMWPRLQDVRDALGNLRYQMHWSHEEPAYGRFAYQEKVEYFALLWGSVVMILTGLMLWFDNQTLHFGPKWVIDVAHTVHYYEAILATFAIILWHLYGVMVNPHVAPMSMVWLTGKATHEQMEEEHAREWEKIRGESAPPPEGTGARGDRGPSE
ncbi:MAG: cytochrome c3 family protein [Acidobacteriota bacterium]|nr:MAG: cytochrome c3 family protein [Acidobacteriota bacterium]